ncbi:cytochrome P450 [Stachybotrys elegans]|uniref:Cytochrome P450 n=1 Tax=Stachybotrys elegans TaxID=80388 RepID=A0A8K0SP10_9HYPO|nr:cytochrome P450 [Stachybotrys elegans]
MDIAATALWALRSIRERMVQIAVLAPLVYSAGIAVYRHAFHPLKRIPGPFWARVTGWYEFYQDVILDGNYIHEYRGLHEKYGPVVRVSPDRVHINDPEYYREYEPTLFSPVEISLILIISRVYIDKANLYKKDPGFYQAGGGIKHSIIMLIDPQAHRQRKEMIRSMFSPHFVDDIAPDVERVVHLAMEQAAVAQSMGQPLDIQRVFQAITVDTIMLILFGKSLNLVNVSLAPEEPPFLHSMSLFADNFLLTKHLPFLSSIAVGLPFWLADKLVPGYARFRLQCREWIDEVDERNKCGVYVAESGRPTLFDLLLNPNEEKGHRALPKDILVDEAFALCFAGTDTTSYALSLTTFYLLKNPDKLQLLRDELATVDTDASGLLNYHNLTSLPYLTAVVKEGLRCSTPVAGITPRIVPAGGAQVGEYYLPEGVTVSQAIYTVHTNESVWPDAERFLPERWLDADPKELNKYFVTFGKGPRMCLGSNITYLELYLTIANFFHRFDMTLYKTDEIRWADSAASRIREHVKVTIDGVRK